MPAPLPHPSPNHGPRRGGARPDIVVLHYTAMRSAEAALARLCDPAAEVSSHYLVGRCGKVWQLVEEPQRAWHAGAGAWAGVEDVNSRSIGIELDNDGASPFSAPLMAALEILLADVMARWSIPPARVIGHAEMAPARKADPGPRFDWQRLARLGLALWPGQAPAGLNAAPVAQEVLAGALDALGYPAADLPARLAAFRARCRPGALGPADAADLWLARAMLEAGGGKPAVDATPPDA